MEKIVITGGLGNIGIPTAKALANKGHQIIIYDNREDRERLFKNSENIKVINGDILDFDHLKRIIIGATGIIHLAALSRVVWGYENPHQCVSVNIMGMTNVLEAARISVRKPWIIFGSSREVYGEPDELPVNEDFPKKIANVYGVTKLTGEFLLEKYCENYGLNALALRFSNVYGSEFDQMDRVIPKFIIRASKGYPLVIQGGKQVFDFTHIEDTVAGILKAVDFLIDKTLLDTISYYNDFHILSGEATKLIDLVEIIKSMFSNEVEVIYKPPRSYDVEKFYGDPSKARDILHYSAKNSIEEGIKKFFNALKKDYLGNVNPLKE